MYHIARIVSNAVNPTLAVLLLIVIILQRDRRMWSYTAACVIAISYSVLLAEVGKAVLFYPDPGKFPSGHETFAVATLTCLVWLSRKWLWFAIPAAVVMGTALVVARYHEIVDVVGAAIWAPIASSAVLAVWQRIAGRTKKHAGAGQ
jgi:membrane-associated phospholipid phosphatase